MKLSVSYSALILSLLVSACSPPPAAPPVPRAVLVRTLGAADAAQAQVYSGEVRARHESELSFRVGGKVLERKVDAGAQVQAGQLLARLDPQDARLSSSAAAAQVAAAEAEAGLARAEFKRSEALLQRNFISASALDLRRSALDAAEARLRQAQAQAASTANQQAYTELLADSAGVITDVSVDAGQVVAAGQRVLRLARPGEREVLVHVPESRLAGLVVDAPATVRLWMAPERSLSGRVREVSPSADRATRTYAVRVAIADADDLPLGATATVALADGGPAQLALPLAAVTQREGKATVWLVDAQQKVVPQTVEIAALREDAAILKTALPAGSRVVVAGVHRLIEGESVRPLEAGSAPALDVRR
ncbi:efflux RND transporter periplasmic adaptor subunit [Azonexus hydrophilus]|uniref:Efflux RND transporter periplasmic adaptor subunit n=1 Tax=Azonexus hydrophilus TaxID=418702 RepID=A0ABZ2XJH2_9RHOO